MPLTRSQQMARIRGQHTKPERILRAALWAAGLRYRLHRRILGSRPDLVVVGPKVVVFIDGCFWHGCPEHYVRPRTRHDFWAAKLARNVDRDRRQTLELEDAGWRVVRPWEHAVWEDLETCVARVEVALDGSNPWSPPAAWRVERVEVVDSERDLEERFFVLLRDPDRTRSEVARRYTRGGGPAKRR